MLPMLDAPTIDLIRWNAAERHGRRLFMTVKEAEEAGWPMRRLDGHEDLLIALAEGAQPLWDSESGSNFAIYPPAAPAPTDKAREPYDPQAPLVPDPEALCAETPRDTLGAPPPRHPDLSERDHVARVVATLED